MTLRARIAAAWRARAGLGDCHRVLHGWGEGVPGLEIDRYGDAVVIEHTADQAPLLAEVVPALDACQRFEVVAARPRGFGAAPVALRGALERRVVTEEGIRFWIDLARAGNPGLYVDARPARAWIRAHSAGRRVLNLFAFSGSLGVAAAVGGARSVTHVDSHPGALEWCRVNSELNGLAVDRRDLARMNIYQHLRRGQAGRQRYDAILLDPPPGPSEPRPKDRTPGRRGVAALAPLCARMLAPGGWLLCFFHRDPRPREAIEAEVAAAATPPLEVLWRGGAGPDVPEPDPARALRVTAFVKIDGS
ncbi:MAG TPA: class I SAM-dependent methyltransferase [Kofleriaceae bacterium]|nr:class I SAM-dependent methyltransferase [Kofleriaceae bacterium]